LLHVRRPGYFYEAHRAHGADYYDLGPKLDGQMS
jgi:hypothetical protein